MPKRKEQPPVKPWFLGIPEAAHMLGRSNLEVEELIRAGFIRLSTLDIHRKRRLVWTKDVEAYSAQYGIGKVRQADRPGEIEVPVINHTPRAGVPNIVFLTPAIRLAREIPVPMAPRSKYFVYVLRQPNGNPFYVGKGTGNRPDEHIAEAVRGECLCRKCKVIQLIHKMGRDVLITYEFETNDAKAALHVEKQMISEWYKTYWLTNRDGNFFYDRPPPPSKSLCYMTRAEFETYLDRMVLPAKERKAKVDQWREDRLEYLDNEWRRFRRNLNNAAAEEIDLERQTLRAEVGDVWQRAMPLFSGGSTAYTVSGLEAYKRHYRKRRKS